METNLVKYHNPEFAYWIGLAQTDGSLKNHQYKKGKRRHVIHIICKDIEHMTAFQKASSKFIDRHIKIHKTKNGYYEIMIGVENIIRIFSDLQIDFSDPPKPPYWILNRVDLFGGYLAGVIDGDGDIRVKNNRPSKQCGIRVHSGSVQKELQQSIKENLNCGCNITPRLNRVRVLSGRKIVGSAYELEFLVSKKNINLVENYILPLIQIPRKRNRLKEFIEFRKLRTKMKIQKWAGQESNL